MRHTPTLIAGVLVTPLSWLLLAYGEDRSAQAFANAEAHAGSSTADFVRPLACLAAAGLLLGILATLRISPLGAMLTGAAYAASYTALMFAPARVLDLFPRSVDLAGHSFDAATPLRTGTAMVIGALLLVATVSVGRWRRKQAPAEPAEPVEQRPAFEGLTEEWLKDPSEPAVNAEPEFATRHASVPRIPGNGGRHDSGAQGEPNRMPAGRPLGYGPGPADYPPRRP